MSQKLCRIPHITSNYPACACLLTGIFLVFLGLYPMENPGNVNSTSLCTVCYLKGFN